MILKVIKLLLEGKVLLTVCVLNCIYYGNKKKQKENKPSGSCDYNLLQDALHTPLRGSAQKEKFLLSSEYLQNPTPLSPKRHIFMTLIFYTNVPIKYVFINPSSLKLHIFIKVFILQFKLQKKCSLSLESVSYKTAFL